MSNKNQTNLITNGNVYLKGANQLGKVKEVEPPKIKYKMVENKTLGMFGTSELPAGIEKLESKFKFNSFYPDVFEKIANPYEQVDLQVRGNIQKFQNNTKVAEEPAVLFLGGVFNELPMFGSLKPQEGIEFDTTMSVNYAKLVVNNKELYEIDVINNICKIAGKDILAQYKLNIGA